MLVPRAPMRREAHPTGPDYGAFLSWRDFLARALAGLAPRAASVMVSRSSRGRACFGYTASRSNTGLIS